MSVLYKTHTKDDAGMAAVTRRLKEQYPGNYTVVETFIPNTMSWGPRMIFEDSADEIWFKLKYE